MIFKNLYINIIIRVILIATTPILLLLAHQKYNDIIIDINISLLFIIQVILLIRRLNYINRDLIAFFDSLKYDDSSILLSNEFQDINYLRLSRRLHIVNKQILKLKEQSLKQDQYFKTITEIANVGLISFNEKGSVKLLNKALKNILTLENISNIKELDKLHHDFSNTLINLNPSEHKTLKVTNTSNNSILQLSLRLADFNTKEEKLKIVSIQNIKNELDEKELDAWQKLIQILRHEIMNSIGPISSTIDTLNDLITDPETNKTLESNKINNELISDISDGLKIIKERNIGLQKFIDGFRSISKLPNPVFQKLSIHELFSEIKLFWAKQFNNLNIDFEIETEDNINFILADKSQIEQVLINLIKNSIESNCNTIKLAAKETSDEKTIIELTDNGTGISKEHIDDIFLPFYTTKEQGSGIGLSLARQIMRLHNGNIYVQSNSLSETTFTLEF